ncbi:peptidase [Saccharospirillum sp. MSK14-1]|uniref:type I secretion system permease/ATPase n=1 Tax=Saccharospirillum sp. MSK14-1 TaxID=1897632 RepID=UPI000D362403|nr:type I secretion system permease/ATPase [Saccharospirillum sp. MSK14-1]PTY36212.1 peptidase [Saccharospirillum sp. MSK14-1]
MKSRLWQGDIAATIAQHRSTLFSVAAFSAAINLLLLAPAIYMLQVYDRVLSSSNESTLLMLTLLVLGLFCLMAAMEWLRGLVMVRLGNVFDMSLNQRVYHAAFAMNRLRGDVNAAQSMRDLTSVRQFLTGPGFLAFLDAPWFPLYLSCIFLFDITLGFFALGGAVVLIVLTLINERLAAAPLTKAGELSIQSSTVAGSSLRNAEAIDAMGMLSGLQQRWLHLQRQFLAHQSQASSRSVAISSVTKGVRLALQSLMLGLAALLVIEGRISAGMMIAASILMSRTLAPIEALIGSWRQWGDTRQAWQRLDEMLAANPERGEAMSLPKPQGILTLDNVTAAIPGTRTAIVRGVNARLEPGSVLGLIGPSGSGKSTLVRLMVGVWPAMGGSVRLDGADLYRWNKNEVGPAMGYLPQTVELFAGTVRDNIARFGAADADQVVAAAQAAGIHDSILQLAQGYDTPLGEGGRGLSQGQKQRLGLARALYGQPALLVLDEPDASLDEVGTQALLKTIAAERERGCSIVIVSHRRELVPLFSHLMVLGQGRMQDFGSVQAVTQRHAQQRHLSTVPRTPVENRGGGQA